MFFPRSRFVATIVVLATGSAAVSARGAVVADWDFDGGTIGNTVVSSTDSVSGLVASPNSTNTADPQYVAGNGGGTAVSFAGISGILEVPGSSALSDGFSQLNVTFDVDLATDQTSGTTALIRNGHTVDHIAFNIYQQANNILGVEMDGSDANINVKTLGSALSASAGWQTVSLVWDGSTVQLLVDGTAQELIGNVYAAPAAIGTLDPTDAPMGIGGLRRSGDPGSVGQFFDGSIDNLVIANTAVVPEPASIALLLGMGGALAFRRRA